MEITQVVNKTRNFLVMIQEIIGKYIDQNKKHINNTEKQIQQRQIRQEKFN